MPLLRLVRAIGSFNCKLASKARKKTAFLAVVLCTLEGALHIFAPPLPTPLVVSSTFYLPCEYKEGRAEMKPVETEEFVNKCQ